MVNCGTMFCEAANFTGSGAMPVLKAVSTAVPPFFAVTIFMIWLFGAASSYFAIAKLTGRKRFWNVITAFSFIAFLVSLLVVAMNDSQVTFLSGYWVGFYILMTVGSYFMLSNYK
jgi:hypothetical protein